METEQKGIGQELSVVSVSKYYGTFRALTDINLVCKPGEFVSIQVHQDLVKLPF